MPVVPRVATPLTDAQMIDPLRYAYAYVANDLITPNRLAFGWAQCCLENAHGRAIYNHNWGNLTVLPSFLGDYYEYATVERGKMTTLRYFSLADHEDGAAMYWTKILGKFDRGTEFTAANGAQGSGHLTACIDAGQYEDACFILSRLNYFTAPPGPYAKTVNSLALSFPHHFPEYAP